MTATAAVADTWQGIVVSLGGTPAPIIQALLARRPAYALFVVSAASAGDIAAQIIPQLDGYLPQYQQALVSDPQVLGRCYQEIRVRIVRWLDDTGLDPARVYMDITGGAKVMSAVLALAAVEYFSDFSYVGGGARKAVTGRVVAGAEQVIQSANPWDTYAVRDLERANGLLRAGQADTAGAVLREAAQRCAGSNKRRLNAFANLAEALARSDRFEFAAAVRIFNQSRNDLELSLDDALFRRLAALCGHWEQVRDEVRASQQTPGGAPRCWNSGPMRSGAPGRGAMTMRWGGCTAPLSCGRSSGCGMPMAPNWGRLPRMLFRPPNAPPSGRHSANRTTPMDATNWDCGGCFSLWNSATMRQSGSRPPITTPSTGTCKIGTNRCWRTACSG